MGKKYTQGFVGKPEEKSVNDVGLNGRIILKSILKKQRSGECVLNMGFRTGISGEFLETRKRTFGFHKMRGVS
jgi:hypothetical protein